MKNGLIIFLAALLVIACNNTDKKTAANTETANLTGKTVRGNAIDTGTHQHTNPTSPAVDSANLTTIGWIDSMDLNMGKIVEGQDLEISYRFRNSGKKPLIISNVRAQCGCTIPETPKEPFAPGQQGVIKAKFSSAGRGGSHNTKEVYVDANTNPATTVLIFHVEVLKKGK
jgi:hypothetical protein